MPRIHGVAAVLFVFWVLIKGVYGFCESASEDCRYVVCEQSSELRARRYILVEQRLRKHNKRVVPKRLYDMAGARHEGSGA